MKRRCHLIKIQSFERAMGTIIKRTEKLHVLLNEAFMIKIVELISIECNKILFYSKKQGSDMYFAIRWNSMQRIS